MRKSRIPRYCTLVAMSTLSILYIGCMRYLTSDRQEVVLTSVDIDQTLKVAEMKMKEQGGKLGTSLPLWVIRDQHLTQQQSKIISGLYFQHIDNLEKRFDVWHLTWAISNMYRLGNDSIRTTLDSAYLDATQRAHELEGIADKMVNGDKLYMGDAHGGGRAFAKKHIVVPGKKGYLQSLDDYENRVHQ